MDAYVKVMEKWKFTVVDRRVGVKTTLTLLCSQFCIKCKMAVLVSEVFWVFFFMTTFINYHASIAAILSTVIMDTIVTTGNL